MSFDRKQPYNDLPPLPPSVDVETKPVLRKAVAAARALAELKGMGGTIPKQSILVNTLVLQEAQASSEIENIVTTTDALFQAASSGSAIVDPATKEVLRYREALWTGYHEMQKGRPLSTNLFVNMVRVLTENQAGVRNLPGTTIQNAATSEVLYTPPQGESVIRDKLSRLEVFIHDTEGMDPLVKLALIHYQFEAIHPFFDGNGRTGRILLILYLAHAGLLDLPVLYLSKAIIEHKADYYALLRGVTEQQAWEPWIVFLLGAVEETAIRTRQRIRDIRTLLDTTLEEARAKLPPRAYKKELIELVFERPYTKVQFVVNAGLAERKTAAEYLHELERIGLLRSQKVGKENLFLNVPLFGLLTTDMSKARP